MRRSGRFALALVAGLGLLAVLAYQVVSTTTRAWFDKDVRLRAKLAVGAAEREVIAHWAHGDASGLKALLGALTRDERIMGAAACGTGRAVASEGYPDGLACSRLFSEARAAGFGPDGVYAASFELPGGPVHISVVSVEGAGEPLAVVLLHDLGFIERREAAARNFVLIGFFVLAASASFVTLLAARLAWRRWVRELKDAVRGEPSGELAPLVRDLRGQVEMLAREREADARLTGWSPERLRAALRQHLEEERVIIVANREPYIHERVNDEIRVVHPASGLVTALEPVMRACSGVWVAHGSGSADREVVDAGDRVRVPPGEESYIVRRVWLTEEEEAGYYYGFSNEGLWPLCHVAHTRPEFRTEDWEQYRRVNERFAEAVCDEADVDDPIILVQDYHFALAPRLIRSRLPRATILTFWHIPWPNAERLGICPWRNEILDGLLGSSIVGFHTRQHCNNFIDSIDAFVEARIDREKDAVVRRSRSTLVRPYPISIEWPVRWLEDLPDVASCRAEVFGDLGLESDALLGVGVDRLDYTKGVEERLLAVGDLLERHPAFRGRFTFVQLAAPSRTRIDRYRDLNDRVERIAAEVNDRWGTPSYRPIILRRAHHEPPTVFRYYRAANVCYVSSLHDGMNLVAKEFVAARSDEQGVLVLSRFTGAARELTEALVVNPYDLRQAGDALATALSMSREEQRERMRSMRAVLSDFNVYRWAGRMLIDAAEVRRRERLTGRLSTLPPTAPVA